MNKKAEKFVQFLKDQEISSFEPIEELDDEYHTVVFRSRIEVEGQFMPFAIVLDDSIYTLLRLQIADKLVKDSNKASILNYINELNRQYKVFKYYVAEDGGLYLDCCMPSGEEAFEGELVRAIIDLMLRHITEHYPIVMKKIWTDLS